MMQAPDTRGLGTGLAALYPAGELAHRYATDLQDMLLLGAFAPPAALAAWVATYKTHGSPRYSGAIAAIVAGPPVWLATAAGTGITNLPTLLAYTATASAAWSAYTWSDVLKARRRLEQFQANWDTIASLAGLEGSRLLRTETTRTGVRFKIDLGVQGPPVSRLVRGDLSEQIARCYGISAGQVHLAADDKNARIAWITLQLVDLWSQPVPHPALTGPDGTPLTASQITASALAATGHGKGQRSILDGPFVIGTDPETGEDLELTLFDEGGARHADIVASNGGGKSNVLSNIVQQGAECYDVLPIAIDLGKGVIPSLWGAHLHDKAGVGEENKALLILEWIDGLVDERAIACEGGTHQPSAQAPVVLLLVDEQDTATGMTSDIAADAKPVLDKVHRRGRSGGVVLVTAKQRDVVQHTGSKEGKANAHTTIVGRVANASEMTKAVPGWETLGCPDMSTYGAGAPGVVLLVKAGGTWQAGRTRALYDPETVKALAAAYGPAEAHLEPGIAAALPGYTDHHPVPTHAVSSNASSNPTHGPAAPRTTGRSDNGTPPPAPTHAETGAADLPDPAPGVPADRVPSPAKEPPGWGFDTTDETEVDKAAKGLVERLDEYINATPPPPEDGIPLTHLKDARRAIDNTSVPDDVAQAVVQLLTERGPAGARRSELLQLFGKVSQATATRWLGALHTTRIIERVGRGPAVRYYLPTHTPDDY
ncbi:hypothetical protein ACSNOI_43400 [Actinomadura kijaniata]|uniref:hypothetical protein n=1 Tax=Actinomadura kijaniata TaxID=46161 RepID=UPI003F1C53F7